MPTRGLLRLHGFQPVRTHSALERGGLQTKWAGGRLRHLSGARPIGPGPNTSSEPNRRGETQTGSALEALMAIVPVGIELTEPRVQVLLARLLQGYRCGRLLRRARLPVGVRAGILARSATDGALVVTNSVRGRHTSRCSPASLRTHPRIGPNRPPWSCGDERQIQLARSWPNSTGSSVSLRRSALPVKVNESFDRRMSGKRRARVANATWPSRRARDAPRQNFGPNPSPT
jgi:hypothetical protein